MGSQRLRELQKERRCVNVRVSPKLLSDIVLYGTEATQVIDGLPEDAIFTAIHHDVINDELILRFYHESFSRVPENGLIPSAHITFRKYNEEAA